MRKFFENIEYGNCVLDKATKFFTTNFSSMQQEIRYIIKERTLYSGVEFPFCIRQFFINVVRCVSSMINQLLSFVVAVLNYFTNKIALLASRKLQRLYI